MKDLEKLLVAAEAWRVAIKTLGEGLPEDLRQLMLDAVAREAAIVRLALREYH